jgi:antitoxin ParD1/3/4
MTRQSITLTMPNDDWLKKQIQSNEFASKSEVVNDLIRKARAKQGEIDLIRSKLLKSENSGFTNDTSKEILKEFKDELNNEGKL